MRPLPYRLLAAFAVLPFVNGLLGFVGFPVVWYIGGHTGRPHDPDQVARTFGILSGILGLIVTAAGAVPVVLWLMKRGPVSLGQLMTVGLVLGNAPFVLYVVGLVLPLTITHVIAGTMSQHLMPISDLVAGTLRALAIGSVMGTVSAIVFWMVGIAR
jgi:hypothetical protein